MLLASGSSEEEAEQMHPENINEGIKRQFIDMLTKIQASSEPTDAIHAYKQLLKIKVDIASSHYESLLLALCRLLTVQKRYGETLYYYLAAPYYLGSMLNAGELMSNTRLKDIAFNSVVQAFHRHKYKVNVLLYNSNLNRVQNLHDTIEIACSQNVYIITEHTELLNRERDFINGYDILIIANNYNSQSMLIIDKFKKKFKNSLPLVLHCYTLEEAKRIHNTIDRQVDYITYNDKMIYAVLHIALNSLWS